VPWAANRLRGLGKIAWSWWSWLFLFCLRGLLFLLLQYSQQVQQNSLQPQLLTLFKPASGQSMPSEPKAFGSPSFWRVTKYLCGIWVADKITSRNGHDQSGWSPIGCEGLIRFVLPCYVQKQGIGKWVVPYRLWMFSHKFEHPMSTPNYFIWTILKILRIQIHLHPPNIPNIKQRRCHSRDLDLDGWRVLGRLFRFLSSSYGLGDGRPSEQHRPKNRTAAANELRPQTELRRIFEFLLGTGCNKKTKCW
jgi:hypothetical protein